MFGVYEGKPQAYVSDGGGINSLLITWWYIIPLHTHVSCLAQNCSDIEKFTRLFKISKYVVIFTASQVTGYCL